MSNQFKTKEFKKLQSDWYHKLKQSGFEDVERNEYALKLWHADYFADVRRNNPELIEAKHNYYRLVGQFLYDYAFQNAWEKKIWALHAEGLSVRDIAAKIKRAGLKDKIHITLKRLETEMINKAIGRCKQNS